jgi:HD superfamily phosphohydrolase YqeK
VVVQDIDVPQEVVLVAIEIHTAVKRQVGVVHPNQL